MGHLSTAPLVNYQLEFSGIWTKSQKSTKSDVICKHLSKNRRIPVTYYALEFSGIWTKTLRARLFCCPKPEEFQFHIENWNSPGLGQTKSDQEDFVVSKPENSSAQKISWNSTVLGQHNSICNKTFKALSLTVISNCPIYPI